LGPNNFVQFSDLQAGFVLGPTENFYQITNSHPGTFINDVWVYTFRNDTTPFRAQVSDFIVGKFVNPPTPVTPMQLDCAITENPHI
ncbi:MAG: hypothetical protein ACRD3W_04440, partial [Terriglobales bacterium]